MVIGAAYTVAGAARPAPSASAPVSGRVRERDASRGTVERDCVPC